MFSRYMKTWVMERGASLNLITSGIVIKLRRVDTMIDGDSYIIFLIYTESQMDWKQYSTDFKKEADKERFSKEYIEKCLFYAKKLFENKLPIIYSQQHLSYLLGFNLKYLYKVSNNQAKFYRYFKIVCSNKKIREISEPLPNLKEIQKWILENILYNCPTNKYLKAYKKKNSIRTNAKFHRGQPKVLNLDIKDYFKSINFSSVNGFFRKKGYSKAVCSMLSNLCTLNGSLPLGAPTSPALSNLVTENIDRRISGFVIKENIRYTRYADDMTFSGSFNENLIIKFVRYVLNEEGFSLNKSKIKLKHSYQRQNVTGIIVNKKLQAPRELRKELRKNMYYIGKYGINSHLEHLKNNNPNYLEHLLGKANYILFINPKDKEAAKYKEKIISLLNEKMNIL